MVRLPNLHFKFFIPQFDNQTLESASAVADTRGSYHQRLTSQVEQITH